MSAHEIVRPDAGPGETPLVPSTRLRLATRAQHEKIETNGRFGRLMAPDLTRTEYRGLLARLYGHHAPAEALLRTKAAVFPASLDLAARLHRAALIEGDLRVLGLTDAEIAALPRCRIRETIGDDEAWGALYVLEGSSLGGQLIVRHLQAILDLGPGRGASGFTPHGTETGVLWRSFKQALDEGVAAGRLDEEAVVRGAQAAFATLDDWVAAGA